VDVALEALGEQGSKRCAGDRPVPDRIDAMADADIGVAGGLVV
jgi:hypothetical protein